MAFQTFENDENNRSQIKRKNLKNEIRSTWLGWRDSNPRMHGPKPCALPLGDTPIYITTSYCGAASWQDFGPWMDKFMIISRIALRQPCTLPLGDTPIC
jgi:hypothetical protein